MPTTRSPCPSTLATKQTTLLVPISRAAITPFLALATMSPVLTLHFRFSWFGRSRRRLRIVGRASLPEIELVRQPKIDDAEFTRQQLVVSVERDQPLERRNRVLLRQPDLDLLLQDQVPATLADPHCGAQLARDGGFVGQQQQEIADMLGRPRAAQQQQGIRPAACGLRERCGRSGRSAYIPGRSARSRRRGVPSASRRARPAGGARRWRSPPNRSPRAGDATPA